MWGGGRYGAETYGQVRSDYAVVPLPPRSILPREDGSASVSGSGSAAAAEEDGRARPEPLRGSGEDRGERWPTSRYRRG